ncbi:LLM class flavin-dependent oxidoreductase [Microlunatus soli]|uniref:Flavin-dependent oxidoreductase, luciferase family (Includes alkanesulfonate monooxygenase SsuD and methylene tetrahydromethanopterin reductase) n=1 Tax=Microlunatus soli TaxID=630515 RepID=A0A1H1P3S0_9ACTN|nr:LLM class flavin-dependent oxidoreductase [Microlunatus soli]SDS05898.1 Flavin-dependent oxidoreductase, luciferase family (includes alkanesulfonate monooxygenase SsuD and methylene tetrahydromethanopterin reductase) [Microlunatus soli]
MKYGLDISAVGEWGDPITMAELARLAEDSGWDGVFLEDYVFFHDPSVPVYDPWVTLAAIAVATSRVTIGTCVTPVARRRVWKLAAEAITVDHLSAGRLVLGVGLGDAGSPDFGGVGDLTDPTARAAALDEGLEVLAALWSGEPVSYQGSHVSLQDVRLPARPVQRPRIPIWVGGCAALPGPRRRALRWDGSCLYGTPPPDWQDLTADDVRALKDEAAAAGNAHFVVAVGGRQRRADLDAEVDYVSSIAAADADWWSEYVPPDRSLEDTRALIAGGPLRAR